MHPNGKLSYIKILGGIGIFVLILACINFMNLATASSAGRGREIGMKKVIGAVSDQLVMQFLGEAMLLTFIALLLAAIMVELLLPLFNNFTGKSIDPGIVIKPGSILMGFGLLAICRPALRILPGLLSSPISEHQSPERYPFQRGREGDCKENPGGGAVPDLHCTDHWDHQRIFPVELS